MSDAAEAVQGARVVMQARRWIGTPYHHQASCLGAGCDCLGLVRGVWREIYGDEPETIPPYTGDWAEIGRRETLLDGASRHLRSVDAAAMRSGDVLVFRWRPHVPAKHCAILSGRERMIHAQENAPVAEVSLGPWWRRRIVGVFRFPLTDEAG